MRSFLVEGKLSGVILHVLNRHAALLNLKQAALLKIMLCVLVFIMQHALHALHGSSIQVCERRAAAFLLAPLNFTFYPFYQGTF